MDRRSFITKAGLVAGGVALAGCDEGSHRTPVVDEDGETSAPDARSGTVDEPTGGEANGWQEVRAQFELSPEKIHMSALLVATHPRPVREAIDRYRRNLNADPVTYLREENNPRKRDVRAAAAEYLGAQPDDIALTDSTTMGIALVYHGLTLRPEQEVITTEHDYYATHEALRQVADRTGATVRRITLFDQPEHASADQITERIAEAITPSTRALALTWVHSSTGLKLPMPQIAEAVANINRDRDEEDRVLICLDGVHGLGVEDATVDDLGCDFLMAGCHKWLFGPRGTGIVWGRSDAWTHLQPMIPSFMDDASWDAWAEHVDPYGPTTAERMSPGGFKPFEHQWAVADAFAFHQEIGKARIAERTHALAGQLKDGLDEMSHVRLLTPQDDALSAGIVCFDVVGHGPRGVVNHLAGRDIIATTTPYAATYPRLTPSIYNTPGEVETVLEAIQALA